MEDEQHERLCGDATVTANVCYSDCGSSAAPIRRAMIAARCA